MLAGKPVAAGDAFAGLRFGLLDETIGSMRGIIMAVAKKKQRTEADDASKAAAPAETSATQPADFTKEQELKAYRDMLLIRRFEEKAGQMYGMGLIGGFCHLYIGQEAVVVGMQMSLKPG